MKRLPLLLLLLFILIVGVVSAELVVVSYQPSYDYVFRADHSSFAVCPCATVNQPLILINTGTYPTIYTIEVDNDLVQLLETEVVIAPGQARAIMTMIKAPCDASFAEEATYTVTSSFNIKKSLTQTITFPECTNMELGLSSLNLTENICDPFQSSLFIKNTGSFVEEYVITPPYIPGTVTLTAGSVLLAPNSIAQIDASFDLPCDLTGSYELEYEVTAKQSEEVQSISQQLYIPTDYNFSLTGPSSLATCQSDMLPFTIEITNNNDFVNDFRFKIDAPPYVTFPNDIITIQGNETVRINGTLDPLFRSYIGEDELTIEVQSKYGDLSKEISINLSVENCYDPQAAFWIPKNKYVCAGDVFTLPFTLLNEGSKELDFEVVKLGTNMAYFEQKNYTVNASSGMNIPLHFNITEEVDDKFPIALEVYHEGTIIYSHQFNLHVDTSEFCYRTEPLQDTVRVRFDEDQKDVFVKNKGTRYNNYSITLLAPSFIEVDDSTIALDVDEKQGLHFSFNNKTAYMEENNLTSLVGVSIPIVLELTHLDSQTSFVHEMTVDFVDYPNYKLVYWSIWERASYTTTCTFVGALLVLFIVAFLIVLFARKKDTYSFPKTLFWTLLLLLVIVALAIFFTKGLPAKTDLYTSHDLETNSTVHLLLEEDSSRDFDLTNFFYDPDGNIVSYEVVEFNDSVLSQKIRGDTLTLTPTADFEGNTNIRLAATDEFNASAVSLLIRVDVLPIEDYTFKELYTFWCIYFNFILFFILCAVLFLAFGYRSR